MPNSIRPYLKAFVPVVLGVIALAIQWITTGTFSASEWQTLGATIVTALSVYAVPNRKVLPL